MNIIGNKNANNLAMTLIVSGEIIPREISFPFIEEKSVKPLTLVMDLDETLIHFKIDSLDENQGTLSLRPGIYKFLNAVCKFYELIIFTASTNEVNYFLLII